MGVQQPVPVPQDQVSAQPSTQPQPPAPPQAPSRPSLLSPPCPLLPRAAQHGSPAPAKPLPGKNVSSPCVPHSAHPDRHCHFFCTTAPGLRHLWPLFSPRSQPFPCLNSSVVSPTSPQGKNPRAMAPASIPTWLLPGRNLPPPSLSLALVGRPPCPSGMLPSSPLS